MWSQYQDSSTVCQKGWVVPSTGEPMAQICMKIHSTGRSLMEWYKSVFQQWQTEMKLVQEKLDTIMIKPRSSDQFDEEIVLQVCFNELLSLDEAYWRQRLQVLWLKDGDQNAAFFHRRASNRCSGNQIKGLTDENNIWHNNPGEFTRILVRYYENIFKYEGVDRCWCYRRGSTGSATVCYLYYECVSYCSIYGCRD